MRSAHHLCVLRGGFDEITHSHSISFFDATPFLCSLFLLYPLVVTNDIYGSLDSVQGCEALTLAEDVDVQKRKY